MRQAAFSAIEWIVLGYFIGLNGGYLLLDLAAIRGITRVMQERRTDTLPRTYSGLEPPITVVVPAYNEEATIEATVQALLQLSYPQYEILVVCDGPKDRTVEVLLRAFRMRPFPEAYRERLPAKPVLGVYASPEHPNLRVVHKENGGKADALNVGINAARYPLFCGVDADSVLQRESLARVARPFLEDARTVAAGGTVRVANGCTISGGFVVATGLSHRPLVLLQIVEYLRAFLFGRLGWTRLNAVLIISGAFGLFDKETVVRAGGYRTDTMGEDMELVVRLHRRLRAEGADYRVAFLPDPICYTEAPEDLRTLARQRIRWQRGLAETLFGNLGLMRPRGGAAGVLAFPFFLVFECLGPVIELGGYVFFALAFAFGLISTTAMLAFLLVAFGLGLLLSVSALLLEELSFHVYPRARDLGILALAAAGEAAGYRQLNTVWRLLGLWRWATGRGGGWGEMRRTASWRADPPAPAGPREAGQSPRNGHPSHDE